MPVGARVWRAGVLAGLALLGGCRERPKPDAAAGFGLKAVSLKGVYGVREGETWSPALQVQEVNGAYQFEERITGEWRVDPEVPHVVSEAEVGRALGVTGIMGFPVYGLGTNQIVLLKLPAGWSNNSGNAKKTVTTKSGFVLSSGGGLVEAKKVELGGR